jgi:hypothetical protein
MADWLHRQVIRYIISSQNTHTHACTHAWESSLPCRGSRGAAGRSRSGGSSGVGPWACCRSATLYSLLGGRPPRLVCLSAGVGSASRPRIVALPQEKLEAHCADYRHGRCHPHANHQARATAAGGRSAAWRHLLCKRRRRCLHLLWLVGVLGVAHRCACKCAKHDDGVPTPDGLSRTAGQLQHNPSRDSTVLHLVPGINLSCSTS